MTGGRHIDVAIVGAGPAGLAAATELKRQGVASVVVFDREPVAGGIPRHCGHSPFGMREFRRLMRGPTYARRLVADALAAGVEIVCEATVVALEAGPRLQIATDAGLSSVSASRVLLATGARESSRFGRDIGGTRPAGVMTVGSLQTMVYGARQRPFKSPVILGTELVAYSALLTCRHAGLHPAAIVEPNSAITARWPAGLLPGFLGVPFFLNTQVVAIEGRERVSAVVVANATRTRRIKADGLIVSGAFRPDSAVMLGSHLIRDPATHGPAVDSYGRCSDPHFFAAGNMLRAVETAGHCWSEGSRIGAAIAQDLRKPLPEPGPELIIQAPEIAWAMPRRPGFEGGLAGLDLRLNASFDGHIELTSDTGERQLLRLKSRPERRIHIPAKALPKGALTLRLKRTRE